MVEYIKNRQTDELSEFYNCYAIAKNIKQKSFTTSLVQTRRVET